MDGDRLKDVGRALVDVIEHARIGPDFGIERAAAGVEHADDLPVAATEIHGVAESQAGVGAVGIFADDQFGQAGVEHAAFDDLHVAANVHDVGRNAADLNVGICAGRFEREGRDDDDFGRDQRSAVGAASDARGVLQDFHLIESDAGHHFRCGAGAHDDGVVFGAGCDERGFESAREREHRDENADGARDAEDGDDCRRPTSFHAANVIDDWNRHVRPSAMR